MPFIPSIRVSRKKVAAILSALLWTAAFLLAFMIAPASPFIWLPDFLLLSGFLPLLFCWRPVWPWLVFGLLNMLVGFILLVAVYFTAPDLPLHIKQVQTHLGQYHVPWVWMLVGLVAAVYAFLRLGAGLLLWLCAPRGAGK